MVSVAAPVNSHPEVTPADVTLVQAALQVRQRAYAPYSRFQVGAAVRAMPDGGDSASPMHAVPGRPETSPAVYAGCNVENASYGLTVCAERAAVFAAVASGVRRLDAVAVVTDTPVTAWPCGACRQVLSEFGSQMRVVSATVSGLVEVTSLDALFPLAFGPAALDTAAGGAEGGQRP